MKTPVTIIGGYLGSGKTTLVNHLLRNADGRRLAILVNEFGDLPIDSDLIEAQDDDIISLAGGCVCCSYGNDLIMAMMDMAKMSPRPDQVILEASGVALPGAIAGALSLLNDFSIDGIVVLADAETIVERSVDKFMGDTIHRQLDQADLILLNKLDLVAASDRMAALTCLKNAAPEAMVIETERSTVPPDVVLQSFPHTANPSHNTHAHHTDAFSSEHQVPELETDPETWISGLLESDPYLVRCKGFVKGPDGNAYTVQSVGRRFEVTVAPNGVAPGVVLIRINPPPRNDGTTPADHAHQERSA